MAKLNQDFTMYQGEDKVITFSITDDNDAPADLSGSSAKWVAVYIVNDIEITIEKTTAGGGVVISGSNYEVTLAASDTTNIYGVMQHELQMIDSSGAVSIVATGVATVNFSYTNIV